MGQADFADSLELIERARDGDRTALRAVLDRYRGRLLERVRLMMGEPARRVAESGDFLQDVLVRVLERFDEANIEGESHLIRWATAIARNNIRDSVRRQREHALESLSHTLSGDGSPDSQGLSPPSRADLGEKVHVLVQALEALDPGACRIVELHVFDGLSFQAIADRLGEAKTTIRDRYHRALVELGRKVRE